MEGPLVTAFLALVACTYASIWVVNATVGQPRGLAAQPPGLRTAFPVCSTLLVVATFASTLLLGSYAAAVPAALGACCLLASVLLHHQSSGICVWGCGMCIVLIVGGAPAPLVFYIACCFGTAFLVSLESFVTMFGPGAVLFSFVAAIVLFIMYIIGPLPLLAAALVGGSTLFYLLLTGAPIRPHRREPLVLGVGCVLGTMAIATQAAHNAVPSAMGMTLVAALLSVAVSYYGRRPGVLGPFYSYERRASVLLLACIVASVLAVAGAEAVSGGSPVLSTMLLQFVGGFATAALLLSVLVYMGDLWEPTSPHMHRFLWVDNASIILYVVIPAALVLAYTPPGQAFLARLLHSYHVIALNLLRVSDVLRNVYRTSAAAWHVALVSSGLSIMSTLLLWHVTASNLALAPLFAQVSAAGSSRSTKIAVTFDRGPDPKTTPSLLQLLKRRGVLATFFVDTTAAQAYPQLLRDIAAAGHEIGALGSGSMSTSAILTDVVKARHAIIAATGTAPEWFRPADGSRDVRLLRRANRAGLRAALWTVSTWDWDLRRTATHLPHWLQSQDVQAGDVIRVHHVIPDYLAPSLKEVVPTHDVLDTTAMVLDHVLEECRLQATTLSDLHPMQLDHLEA